MVLITKIRPPLLCVCVCVRTAMNAHTDAMLTRHIWFAPRRGRTVSTVRFTFSSSDIEDLEETMESKNKEVSNDEEAYFEDILEKRFGMSSNEAMKRLYYVLMLITRER